MRQVICLASVAAFASAGHASISPSNIAGTLQTTGTVTEDTGQYLGGLIRHFSNDNVNRYVAEFDVSSLANPASAVASISGGLEFRQSGYSGMYVEFFLYAADGSLNFADDWNPAGAINVGSTTVAQYGDVLFGPIAVSSAFQSLVSANPGLTHVGVQVRPDDGARSLHEVENLQFNVAAGATPTPSGMALLCTGLIVGWRRRR